MKVELEIGKHVRCDIITYSGADFGGKRGVVRVFPTGSVQGRLDSDHVASMIIRAHLGTRVILCSRTGDDWEQSPWRCIRMLEGHCLPGESATDLPGVRIPNVDFLDPPKARRSNPELQSSYPLVERFEEGEGWTFGTVGIPSLVGHVRRIILEKDDGQKSARLQPAQRVARAILERARQVAPDALPALAEAARAELPVAESTRLQEWLDTQG